ncbi:MAG: hypothetical protein MMC33_010212 [Icmadophila ericetorum]|nr:hypothetical protein [Icmadophila ericetorum]
MASLVEQTIPLVRYVAGAAGNTQDVGNMTSSIYDTAWVSMVRKSKNALSLLFPECFQYVLDKQLPSGAWESYDSTIDGIVNTLGGLFALKKNSHMAYSSISQKDLNLRIEGATRFLQEELQSWDVTSADHVGFEIIIPAMLELLSQEGIHFDFPGRSLLMELNQKKLSKIPSSIWSAKIQTTLTHSLEAFIGKVDFDTIGHQLVYGAMGSSPASTAAYLMFSSHWNDDAEKYLRNVVETWKRYGYGGVPTMYPSTGFEVLWIGSTLLEYGFEPKALPGIESLLEITDEYFQARDGLASGFSNLSVSDADDTAKSILVRNLLGRPTTPDNLIKRFEGSVHFLTYGMERHPSLTTNCNILSAILESPDPQGYVSQIEKCARFLVSSWSRSDASFIDKWSISEFYPIMLMSESLTRLLYFWDKGVVKSLPEDLILDGVSLVLFQALLQTLQKQNTNGSWGPKPSREITAYAIIALANLASLPFVEELSAQIETAIERGRSYIENSKEPPSIEYVWVAKVTYSPVNISKAYILAALKTSYPKYRLGALLTQKLNIPRKGVRQYMRIYSTLPQLHSFPLWRIQGCIIEGYLYLRRLKRVRLDMFGRANMKKDEYFDFIALTFACANNLRAAFLRTDVLFDMMSLVLRVYQVDEYVEHVIGKKFGNSIEHVKNIVDDIFVNEKFEVGPSEESKKRHSNGFANGQTGGHLNGDSNGFTGGHGNGDVKHLENSHTTNGGETPLFEKLKQDEDFLEIHDKLNAFARSIICHPSVSASSASSGYDRNLLKHELRECLLSHIMQIEDSHQYLTTNGADPRRNVPRGSFYTWVRTTAASHSCAPLSLAFLQCLLKNQGCFGRSVEEQYLIQDLWTHLSNKCRMENDRASLKRDREEKNLNSLDFPEFGLQPGCDSTFQGLKRQLSPILAYERKCCELAFEALQQATCAKARTQDLEALKFYYFLSDIYNDVYAMRDISCEA